MWRNYVIVGIRALAKSRTYAFINIFGLGDRHGRLPDDPSLRALRGQLRPLDPRVRAHLPGPELVQVERDGPGGPAPDDALCGGQVARDNFPQIEREVYVSDNDPVFCKDGQATSTEDYLWVDGNFLEVVPLPMVRGDRQRAWCRSIPRS